MQPSALCIAAKPVRDNPVGLWCNPGQAQRYDSAANHGFYAGLLTRLLAGAGPFVRGHGLDLGCGSGFATEGLVRAFPGLAWEGLDVSGPLLARAANKRTLARVALRQAAAEAMPYADHSFDVVVCNFAWHWFAPAAGREVARVLRPGGWLLLSAPVRQLSSAAGNRWLARRLHAQRHGFRRFASQGLRLGDLTSLLSGEVRTRRLESVVIEEQFPDAQTMLASLESRGSLQAIFGAGGWDAPADLPAGGLAFEWHVGLLQAQVRP